MRSWMEGTVQAECVCEHDYSISGYHGRGATHDSQCIFIAWKSQPHGACPPRQEGYLQWKIEGTYVFASKIQEQRTSSETSSHLACQDGPSANILPATLQVTSDITRFMKSLALSSGR